MIKLAVFLGNPGINYKKTRHNAGWMVLDAMEGADSIRWQDKWNSQLGEIQNPGGKIRILKPLILMNLSGLPVSRAAVFFNLEPDEILVVHDDLELDFGTIHDRFGGGLGGHKGLKSIKEHLGSTNFYRIRFGISRPVHGSVSSWVLGRFDQEEEPLLSLVLQGAADLAERRISGTAGDPAGNRPVRVLQF